jgi:hypothetical protein
MSIVFFPTLRKKGAKGFYMAFHILTLARVAVLRTPLRLTERSAEQRPVQKA